MSKIIESKIEKLRNDDLFIMCDIDFIMDNIDHILAGNVGENWMVRFVEALK